MAIRINVDRSYESANWIKSVRDSNQAARDKKKSKKLKKSEDLPELLTLLTASEYLYKQGGDQGTPAPSEGTPEHAHRGKNWDYVSSTPAPEGARTLHTAGGRAWWQAGGGGSEQPQTQQAEQAAEPEVAEKSDDKFVPEHNIRPPSFDVEGDSYAEYLGRVKYGDTQVKDIDIIDTHSSPEDLKEAVRTKVYEVLDGFHAGGDGHVYKVSGDKVELVSGLRTHDTRETGMTVWSKKVPDSIYTTPIFHRTDTPDIDLSDLQGGSGRSKHGGPNYYDGIYFTTHPDGPFGDRIIETRISPGAKVITVPSEAAANSLGMNTEELREEGVDVILGRAKDGEYDELVVINPKVLSIKEEEDIQPQQSVGEEKESWEMTQEEFDESSDTVFHGTKAEFDRFKLIDDVTMQSDPGLVGSGVYFTPSKEQAEEFAKNPLYGHGDMPRVISARVGLKNPAIIQDGVLPDGRTLTEAHPRGITKESGKNVHEALKDAGYDGAIFQVSGGRRGESGESEITQVVTFDPTAIKTHRELVEQAMSEGKDVSDEVLSGYPDLAPAAQPQQAEEKGVVGQGKEPWEMTQEEFASPAPLPQAKPGNIILYHTTEAKNLSSILQEGLDPNKNWGGEGPQGVVWGVTSPEGYSGHGAVVGVEIPESQLATSKDAEWLYAHGSISPDAIVYVDKPSELTGNRIRTERAEEYAKKYHELHVEKALADGKPVSEEVLRDYPDLSKEQPQQAEEDIKKSDDLPELLALLTAMEYMAKQEESEWARFEDWTWKIPEAQKYRHDGGKHVGPNGGQYDVIGYEVTAEGTPMGPGMVTGAGVPRAARVPVQPSEELDFEEPKGLDMVPIEEYAKGLEEISKEQLAAQVRQAYVSGLGANDLNDTPLQPNVAVYAEVEDKETGKVEKRLSGVTTGDGHWVQVGGNTDININTNPNGKIQSTHVAPNGSPASTYSWSWSANSGRKKFDKIDELIKSGVMERLSQRAAGDMSRPQRFTLEDTADENFKVIRDLGLNTIQRSAMVAALIFHTARRPGGAGSKSNISVPDGDKLMTGKGKVSVSKGLAALRKVKPDVSIVKSDILGPVIRGEEKDAVVSQFSVRTFGISTLQKRHIVPQSDGSVMLSFIGKSAKVNHAPVTDPVLVKKLTQMSKDKKLGDEDYLFSSKAWGGTGTTPLGDVNPYIRGISVDAFPDMKITAKDFRTLHANVAADRLINEADIPSTKVIGDRNVSTLNQRDFMESIETAIIQQVLADTATQKKAGIETPLTSSEVQNIARMWIQRRQDGAKLDLAEEPSGILGNDPGTCLGNYINPDLFDEWNQYNELETNELMDNITSIPTRKFNSIAKRLTELKKKGWKITAKGVTHTPRKKR
jgi:hypothetical protein